MRRLLGGPSRSGRLVWLLAGLAALPAVVAAVSSIGVDWTPASDYGPIEVRVRDVFSAHPPLVGPYSRLGGNHPGPALFFLLAVPYRLLGAQPWTLLFTAAACNAAWVAGAVRIAGRNGRVGLAALTTVFTLACTWGLGVDHLRDVWNPRLPLFAFLLAAVATWATASGSRRSLPVAAVAASFSAQSHVGYVPLAAVVFAWCGWAVWRHRASWPAWRVATLATVALMVAMWALPIAQQVAGPDGNLAQLVANVDGTGEAKQSLTGAGDLLLPHLGPIPPWFRATPDDPFEVRGRTGLTWPPLGLVAFVVGVAVAVRRRDRDPLLLLAVTATLWIAGAWSVAQISGLPYPYLFRWIRVLGILLWVAALWPIGRALLGVAHHRLDTRPERSEPSERVATPATVLAWAAGLFITVLAVGVAAGEVGNAFSSYRQQYRRTAVVAQESLGAVRRAPGRGRTVEVRSSGALVFTVPAVVAALERSGYHVLIDESAGAVWGGHRDPDRSQADLLLVVTDEAGPREGADQLRRAATVDLLTAEQRRTLRTLPSKAYCAADRFGVGEARAGLDRTERCRRRSELAPLDRRAGIWIGPAPR